MRYELTHARLLWIRPAVQLGELAGFATSALALLRIGQTNAFIACVILLYLRALWPAQFTRGAFVEADQAGLWIKARLAIPSAQVLGADIAPHATDYVVHFRWRNVAARSARELSVRVPTIEAGSALLSAMGLVGHLKWRASVAGEFKETSGFVTLLVYAAPWAPFLLSKGALGASLFLVLLWGPCCVLVLRRAGAEVRVGNDGIYIRGFRHRRFISYAHLAGIGVRYGTIALRLRSGGAISISPSKLRLKPLYEPLAAFVTSADGGNDPETGAAAEGLRLGERSLREWHATFSRAARNQPFDGTYRTDSITPERLLGIVEDSTIDPRARAGAALALRGQSSLPIDEQTQSRLRVAALASASPWMRAVLEGPLADPTDARFLRTQRRATA